MKFEKIDLSYLKLRSTFYSIVDLEDDTSDGNLLSPTATNFFSIATFPASKKNAMAVIYVQTAAGLLNVDVSGIRGDGGSFKDLWGFLNVFCVSTGCVLVTLVTFCVHGKT